MAPTNTQHHSGRAGVSMSAKERLILFSAPMVRAILSGKKTQTRRVVKPQPQTVTGQKIAPWEGDGAALLALLTQSSKPCPYGQPGDRLWIRETFCAWGCWETRYSAKKGRAEMHFVDMTLESGRKYLYAADNDNYDANLGANQGLGVYPAWWKRPAIFMSRAASRIALEITGVRVQRLQDISEADVAAEGIEFFNDDRECGCRNYLDAANKDWTLSPRDSFRSLWQSINGHDSWDANPWVWVIEFRRVS